MEPVNLMNASTWHIQIVADSQRGEGEILGQHRGLLCNFSGDQGYFICECVYMYTSCEPYYIYVVVHRTSFGWFGSMPQCDTFQFHTLPIRRFLENPPLSESFFAIS